MKKIVLTIMIVFCMSSVNFAKDYNTGIGLRGGFSNGLTLKHFISNNTALEGILSSRWQGIELTGLYEIHYSIANAERLNWYIGFGGHIGSYNGDKAKWGDTGTSYTILGLDGIIGLEYNFIEIPINISIDWKPEFNVFGYSGFWGDGGALSVRYIF